MENGRWIILIVGYIPLWEDSQWYVRKPTPELAEDCQLCWWKCEKRIILLICSYHCERIHRSISWNLRQNWQRIASSVGGNVKKKNYTTDLFIPLWEDSQEHIMKPTSELAEDCQLCWWECKKKKYTIDCSYHCERIHRSILWNLC
jgi:hypothetical protein